MSMPLLSTKLSVKPPRADFVPRPHLVEKLNEGAKQKLTLICAPAAKKETQVRLTLMSVTYSQVFSTIIQGVFGSVHERSMSIQRLDLTGF